jgi:hypothetical protein
VASRSARGRGKPTPYTPPTPAGISRLVYTNFRFSDSKGPGKFSTRPKTQMN